MNAIGGHFDLPWLVLELPFQCLEAPVQLVRKNIRHGDELCRPVRYGKCIPRGSASTIRSGQLSFGHRLGVGQVEFEALFVAAEHLALER